MLSIPVILSTRHDRAKKESGDFKRILEGMNSYRLFLAHLVGALLLSAETPRFQVITYNLENYLVDRTGPRVPKPAAARPKTTQTLASPPPHAVAV